MNTQNLNKATQLKCAFSNAVHKILEPNWNKTNAEKRKAGVVRFSDAKKIELFNEIMALHGVNSNQIGAYKFNKREAKRRYLKMVAEGKTPKQKTTLAQWIAMQNQLKTA